MLVLFLLVPLLPGRFWTHVSTEVLILGLFAMSLNLLYGYMGQICSVTSRSSVSAPLPATF